MILRNKTQEICQWVLPLYTMVVPEPVNNTIDWKKEFTTTKFNQLKADTNKIIDSYKELWFEEVIGTYQYFDWEVDRVKAETVFWSYWFVIEWWTDEEIKTTYNKYQFTENISI